jgi:hypothetical protein
LLDCICDVCEDWKTKMGLPSFPGVRSSNNLSPYILYQMWTFSFLQLPDTYRIRWLVARGNCSHWVSKQPNWIDDSSHRYSRSLLSGKALINNFRVLTDSKVFCSRSVCTRSSGVPLSSHRSLKSRSGTSWDSVHLVGDNWCYEDKSGRELR